MSNRYLVLSDLHLADVEDHADGWRSHKSSRFVFDGELEALAREFLASASEGDALTLVLNGDIVDFDLVTAVPDPAPWPVSSLERGRGLEATAAKSAWKLKRVLACHPRFVALLRELLTRGHDVIYVLGNHNRELHFLEVQEVLRRAVGEGGDRIRFEPWFYYVPGEIYCEHGHQYDYYTSFRYQLWPVVEKGGHREPVIALPMGNLSNRLLMSKMGFFNPHASDYILNLFRYLAHWLRHYAFSRRNLALNWFWGSLLVLARLLGYKRRLAGAPPRQEREQLDLVARRYGLAPDRLRALSTLQRVPIMHRFYRMIRELWIDRLAIALVLTGGTVTLALVPVPLWVKLMVPLTAFPLLYSVYEWLAQGETIFSHEQVIPENARAISRLLPARVIAFGHTHVPRLIPLAREVTFVDTGTWAPVTSAHERQRLRPGLRNFLLVAFGGRQVEVRLGSWMQGELRPVTGVWPAADPDVTTPGQDRLAGS